MSTLILRVLRSLFARPTPAGHDEFSRAFGLYSSGRLDEAERACAWVQDVPRADVDYLLGLIAERRRKLGAAADFFARAAAGRPGEPAFRLSAGDTLLRLHRHADALAELEAFVSLATPADPRVVKACLSCAACCLGLGDAQGAVQWRSRALASSRDPAGVCAVANAYYQDSDVDTARELLAGAIPEGDTAAQLRRAMMLPAIYTSREHIGAVRARLEAELEELLARELSPVAAPEKQIGVLPFYLAYHNENNAGLMRKVCAVMRRACPGADAPRAPAGRAPGRIKVGFVSTYFHAHSVARITAGMIRDLPRERFEVHVFAIEPAEDALKRSIQESADRYRLLPDRLDAVLPAVSEARLDALVFADLGMHPTTYFLALHRIAPLQMALWGHSETSGIDTVDYYLTGAGVEPENADAHYSERLVRPDAFFLAGYPRPVVPAAVSRDSLGLGGEARLYGCLQPGFKLHPDMDGVFASILREDPRAILLLAESRPAWAALLRERFARSLGAEATRVRFLPPMPHGTYMATLRACDVALDPLYFGGANSSCEAFAMGLPVITLPGSHAYGRFTLGLYREMGVEDCVAHSVESYVSLAVRVAGDPDRRDELGRAIGERSHVLFERRDMTFALADFLESALPK